MLHPAPSAATKPTIKKAATLFMPESVTGAFSFRQQKNLCRGVISVLAIPRRPIYDFDEGAAV
jgi:hypothetical protein